MHEGSISHEHPVSNKGFCLVNYSTVERIKEEIRLQVVPLIFVTISVLQDCSEVMATESFEMDCCIKIKSPTFRQEIAGIVSLHWFLLSCSP